MSHQAVTWAYAQDIDPPLAKFVLVTLADFASAEGFCFPGQSKLSDLTGISERAIRSHLVALEQAGILRRQFRYDDRGKRTSDGFWLVGFAPLPAELAASLPAESATSAERLPAARAASKRSTTGKKRRDYRQITSSLPANLAGIYKDEPSVEPSVNVVTAKSPLRVVARDPLWDVCVELYGDITNDGERGKRNRALKHLRQSGATVDEIRRRDLRMRQKWRHLSSFTANGLADNWSEFDGDDPDDNYWTPERLEQLGENGYIRHGSG